MRGELIVFLGPSLPAREARRIAKCTVLPPARQGDVWRALLRGPAAIALIDGVFEAQPSVWHRELLDALDCGVRLYGASSMGALRAAELRPFGMRGVGQVYAWIEDGSADDADVALLHADAEHGFRPLAVPHVTVRYAAERARAARVLRPAEARTLVAASAATFYQERTWPKLLAALPEAARARWARWSVPDVKALDAIACIRAAARPEQPAKRKPSPRSSRPARDPFARARAALAAPSALVRGRKLRDAVPGALDALRMRADAAELRDAGLRRALLASLARERGVHATAEQIAEAEAGWMASLGVPARDREAFLAASGLDEIDARRLCEELALERLALQMAGRLVSDGPSADEALAAEARLRGHWAALRRSRRR